MLLLTRHRSEWAPPKQWQQTVIKIPKAIFNYALSGHFQSRIHFKIQLNHWENVLTCTVKCYSALVIILSLASLEYYLGERWIRPKWTVGSKIIGREAFVGCGGRVRLLALYLWFMIFLFLSQEGNQHENARKELAGSIISQERQSRTHAGTYWLDIYRSHSERRPSLPWRFS